MSDVLCLFQSLGGSLCNKSGMLALDLAHVSPLLTISGKSKFIMVIFSHIYRDNYLQECQPHPPACLYRISVAPPQSGWEGRGSRIPLYQIMSSFIKGRNSTTYIKIACYIPLPTPNQFYLDLLSTRRQFSDFGLNIPRVGWMIYDHAYCKMLISEDDTDTLWGLTRIYSGSPLVCSLGPRAKRVKVRIKLTEYCRC